MTTASDHLARFIVFFGIVVGGYAVVSAAVWLLVGLRPGMVAVVWIPVGVIVWVAISRLEPMRSMRAESACPACGFLHDLGRTERCLRCGVVFAEVENRCVACGYSLDGLGEEDRCPECEEAIVEGDT